MTITTTVENFWHLSLNDQLRMFDDDPLSEEDKPAEPVKFKPYRGLPRYPLPQCVPLSLGDARAAFPSSPAQAPAPAEMTPETLSSLLYYSFGISRHDLGPAAMWPYHRVVASARCFFPTELYCWLPAYAERPAGLYYYDPAHHALVLLREGDHRALLGAATGADLDEARCVFVLSSLFWKNAFVYGNYGYRLCAQEVGILVGNLFLVGAALGLRGQIHQQFLDAPLNKLLGLRPPAESVMSVVPLYPTQPPVRHHRDPVMSADLLAAIQPIETPYLTTSSFDAARCAMLVEIHAATLCETTDDFSLPADTCPPDPLLPGALRAPEDTEGPVELATALRRRDSGLWSFNSVLRPIPAEMLWRVVRYALEAHPSDLVPPGTPPLVDCYVVVNHVVDLAPGVCRLHPEGPALVSVLDRPVAHRLQAIQLLDPPVINYGSVNAVVFLVGDRVRSQARFGDRALRILPQEAGLIAQRICVMSATVGLAGRVHNGYRAAAAAQLLGLGDRVPIYQILIGVAGPTARYQMPVVF